MRAGADTRVACAADPAAGGGMEPLRESDLALLARAELFRGIPPLGMEQLVCSFLSGPVVETHPAGRVLLEPGCANDRLFVVLEGALTVQLEDELHGHLLALGPGQCFGEMSLIDRTGISATVLTMADCRLLSIASRDLWPMMRIDTLLAFNLMQVLSGRVRSVNKALIRSHHIRRDLEHEIRRDALTGVFNRRWIDEQFARELEHCQREARPATLLMCDIDHFKQLNDQHGHALGDRALRVFAETLAQAIRPGDLLGRYGGEEFALLLPDAGGDTALGIAERLRQAVAAVSIPSTSAPVRLSASFGAASWQPGDASCSIDDLFLRADEALYAAKRAGRNRTMLAAAMRFSRPDR